MVIAKEYLAILIRNKKAGLTTTLVIDRLAQIYSIHFKELAPLQQFSLCKLGLKMSWNVK